MQLIGKEKSRSHHHDHTTGRVAHQHMLICHSHAYLTSNGLPTIVGASQRPHTETWRFVVRHKPVVVQPDTKSLSMWYNKGKCMWKGMKISNGTSNHTSGLTCVDG